MRKLLYIVLLFICVLNSCRSNNSRSYNSNSYYNRGPMCKHCKNIEVYISPLPERCSYLILDYINSLYYSFDSSARNFVNSGYFTIHNDSITLESLCDIFNSKKLNIQKELYPESSRQHYLIEKGGDSIYMCKYFSFYEEGMRDTIEMLDIRRYYKCNGSLKYVPKGAYLYKDADRLKDSLKRVYNSRN